MRKLFTLFSIALLVLTSCMKSDGDGNTLTYKRGCYNRVVKSGSEDAFFELVMCEYTLDFDKGLSSFSYEGLSFGGSDTYNLVIENIPFSQTQTGYVFSTSSENNPVLVNGIKAPDWNVSRFSGEWESLGDYTKGFSEFFNVEFVVSVDNVVYRVQSNMLVYSFLDCVNNITLENGDIKGFNGGTYTITFNPGKKISEMKINQAKLSATTSLSVDNWILKNIPTEPTYNGFQFAANPDSIFIPQQNGYMIPDAKIKIVSGLVFIPTKSLVMRMIVNGEQVDVRAYLSEQKTTDD